MTNVPEVLESCVTAECEFVVLKVCTVYVHASRYNDSLAVHLKYR